MAAAAKKRKAEEQDQGQSRKKVKKEPSEQGQSAAPRTEAASSQKSKRVTDKNPSEEPTEECFRQAALGLRSLSGDLEGMPSVAAEDSESRDKDSSALEVRVKEEKVDNGYEDSSKAVSDCSLKDSEVATAAKGREVEVKFEAIEQVKDEDEDSDDADILLKIQKQCATIQSTGGASSKNSNHVTDVVAHESFQMTEPSSRPEAEVMGDKQERECERERECEPLNSQWSIVSEVADIKTEPQDECSFESTPIEAGGIKEEMGVEKVEPKEEPVETSDKQDSTAEESNQLHITGLYAADAALQRESVDRLTAATALTAVGQPLVGQPPVAQHQLVVQLPVQPSAQSLTQTTLAPAAQTLIQLASSSPAHTQQIVLTGAVQGGFLHAHQNPHQVLAAATVPPHSQAQVQAQPPVQAQAAAEPVAHPQPHQLVASSAPASGFLQDSDLQVEEAAAFEVLAEWSSMSAAHQQMSSSSPMVDDEHTNDSIYSSSSNEDSSNSNNGAYNGKGYFQCGWYND